MSSLARPESLFLGDGLLDAHFWRLLLLGDADELIPPETLRRAVTAVVEQTNEYTAAGRYRRYRDGTWHTVSRASRRYPTAVYLYDAAEKTEVLCLDLDPKADRTAADVEVEAGELTRLLERCGLRWIADRSTRGGVHVLIRLDERRHRSELSALQAELRRWFPSIDPAVMAGSAAMLTMPGSPCKPEPGDDEFRYRQLLGVHSTARLRDWLAGPSTPAAWAALRTALGSPTDSLLFTTGTNESFHAGAPLRPGLPEVTPTALRMAGEGTPEDDQDGMPGVCEDGGDRDAACPVRRWPVQRSVVRTPDAVPAAVAELAATGVHGSGDRSRGAWAVVCAVLEAGWSRESWLARVIEWPELAGYRALRGHKAADLRVAAGAEWDRAVAKGVRPLAGSKAVRMISGEVRLPADVGAWVGAAHEVLTVARATKVLRVDAAANVKALVEGLARLGAERGAEFRQAIRGMAGVAGLSRSGVEHARDWLRAQGLLVTEAQRPDLTRRDIGEEDWTRWTLVVPDGVTAEPVTAVPILEPLWAALGWVHREVWAAAWRVESLGELATELGIGNRTTLTGYLARLADVGLYRPVPRKVGVAVPLMQLDSAAYEGLCGEWRTTSEQLRADRWESVMARQREVGSAKTVQRLRGEPTVDAAWRRQVEARETLVDLEAYACRLAEGGEVLDLTDSRQRLAAVEAQLEAEIAEVERNSLTGSEWVSGE